MPYGHVTHYYPKKYPSQIARLTMNVRMIYNSNVKPTRFARKVVVSKSMYCVLYFRFLYANNSKRDPRFLISRLAKSPYLIILS